VSCSQAGDEWLRQPYGDIEAPTQVRLGHLGSADFESCPEFCDEEARVTDGTAVYPSARRWAVRGEASLVLQQHFVVIRLSSLVVAGFSAVLVAAAPAGPGPGGRVAGRGGDQVCQETADLAERAADEAAARAFGEIAAVTARLARASMASVVCGYQAS
jgi:hypothetical protein